MTDGPLRVLIAEDDVDIASTLSRGLAREGFDPRVAHDAQAALAIHRGARCGAAVIDMMLGQDRGDDLVRALRLAGLSGPILMLSALSGVEDRSDGLDSGADDYIAKPFDMAELVTRLRVHQHRRARVRGGGGPRYAGLTYDPDLREVTGAARRVTLTQREGDLLAFLIAHADRLISRGEIFDRLWAGEGGSSENVVDVYIGYLRRKLAPIEDFGASLRTIRGRGFMLTERTHADPNDQP